MHKTMIRSRKASDVLGDTARVMTSDTTDTAGRVWPKGTVYQPISSGSDGQTISIRGERVQVQSCAHALAYQSIRSLMAVVDARMMAEPHTAAEWEALATHFREAAKVAEKHAARLGAVKIRRAR